ncbi:MAG: hybrid sensor histidine kinase/response regulator [Campylobacterota bacterium]|nr:hybrid sensor histidine kinase/response regulator [Campylobacterota bacterium]
MKYTDLHKYTQDLNILYVEDDSDVLHNTADVLSKFFKKVDSAQDGQEALELYKDYFEQNTQYYDLVITDLNMPKMDGEALIEHIHEICIEQVIIVVSAYSESSRLMRLIELGIANFLLKPISLSQVTNVLYKSCKAIYDQRQRLKLEIEKNILIQKKIFNQEKLNSMNYLIKNIAHQWRQPLSVISTGATGLIVSHEFGDLSDDLVVETCESINKTTQYLSNILDNFIGFIDGNIENDFFDLKEKILISKVLVETETEIKYSDIELIIDIDDNLKVYGCANEFMQCIINILINSYDALIETEGESKYIFIETFTKDNNIVLVIKDNGGGIDKGNLEKVFEPYFTTKHQSQGKGLSMYITYNYITEGMKGHIDIQNSSYEYMDENYIGAKVTITLPLSHKE